MRPDKDDPRFCVSCGTLNYFDQDGPICLRCGARWKEKPAVRPVETKPSGGSSYHVPIGAAPPPTARAAHYNIPGEPGFGEVKCISCKRWINERDAAIVAGRRMCAECFSYMTQGMANALRYPLPLSFSGGK